MSIEASQLLLLLNWMSPAFPTGAFAYSHGLEWAIEAGSVTHAEDLKGWIGDLLSRGSGWNDAVLFARCWHDDIADLNELALALATSKERHLETTQLGRSFGIAAGVYLSAQEPSSRRKPGPSQSHQLPFQAMEMAQWVPAFAGMTDVRTSPRGEEDIAYPIAAGAACAAMGLDKRHALLAYCQGFSAALTSVAVRLVPIGQMAGLETLRDLMPVIAAVGERAAEATLDELGAVTIAADIAAMKHETQYSRVFRT